MALVNQFSELLAPGLRAIVGSDLEGRESHYSSVLQVESSTRNYEEYLAGAGLPIAVEKPEAQPIQTFDPLLGDTKRVEHTVYGIGFEISEEAHDDDLYKGNGSPLASAASSLAASLAEVVEIQAHRFFNAEAFLTSAVPEMFQTLPKRSTSVSLFNSAHAGIDGGEVGTQGNRPSSPVDLTITSYRAALTVFRRYRNDRNLRIPGFTMPKTLLVAPEMEWEAQEVVGSSFKADPNRTENVSKNKTSVQINPYLDDPDAWFLLAPKHMLKFIWRKRPMLDNYDDKSRGVAVFVGKERFSATAVHWLGTYGSPGA